MHRFDRSSSHNRTGAGHPRRKVQKVEQGCFTGRLEIASDRCSIDVCVEVVSARERHFADDIEGGRQHLCNHFMWTIASQAFNRALGCRGHHRSKSDHITLRENRCHCPTLPTPLRIF